MTQSQLVEKIRGMPVAEQVALAETILNGLDTTVRSSVRERARRQMEESAREALDYYNTDPEVALWRAMEGEPFHE